MKLSTTALVILAVIVSMTVAARGAGDPDGCGVEMGRVDLGGRPPRPPTDPDLPVEEASGSSSHDFATRPAKPWTTRVRGRLYRFSRRRN